MKTKQQLFFFVYLLFVMSRIKQPKCWKTCQMHVIVALKNACHIFCAYTLYKLALTSHWYQYISIVNNMKANTAYRSAFPHSQTMYYLTSRNALIKTIENNYL